jgi:hypothetical protein
MLFPRPMLTEGSGKKHFHFRHLRFSKPSSRANGRYEMSLAKQHVPQRRACAVRAHASTWPAWWVAGLSLPESRYTGRMRAARSLHRCRHSDVNGKLINIDILTREAFEMPYVNAAMAALHHLSFTVGIAGR